jgi:hypothetical protein
MLNKEIIPREIISCGTNRFASEEKLFCTSIGSKITGFTENSKRFEGILESFDEHWLYLRIDSGKVGMVRRKKISSLEMV